MRTALVSSSWKKKHLGLNNRIGLDFLSRSDVAAANRGAAGGFGFFLLDKKDLIQGDRWCHCNL